MPSEKKEKKEAFIDSLSSDNIACFRVRLGSSWVKIGVHPTRPDPTQASSVLHSIAAIISTMSLRFTK